MADIFICYSGQGKADAIRIAKALELDDWSVFIDKSNLIGGTEWHTRIFDIELKETKCLVAVVNQETLSGWMKNEIVSFLIYEHERIEKHILPKDDRIIPVYLIKCDRPSILHSYTDVELFEWDDDTSTEQWQNFIKALSQWVERTNNQESDAHPLESKVPEEQLNIDSQQIMSKIINLGGQLRQRIERAEQIHEFRVREKNDAKLITESKRHVDQLKAELDKLKK